jgi:two-component system NtrC family sensor kinase
MTDVDAPAVTGLPQRPLHRRIGLLVSHWLTRLLLGRDTTAELIAERERLSAELARRLSELYSLQELAHVLSASLRFDRVVAEVARYAMRALDATGAAVILAPEHGGTFEVRSAKGVLSGQLGRVIDPESGGMVLEAIGHERVLLRSDPDGRLLLLEGLTARTAVAAPLRAHGVTVGAIVVTDKLLGDFTNEDARLLSTAATHAAVVLANARFFELVRVGKEQWEDTFDALAEGIAIVDAGAVVRRANTAMAALMHEAMPSAIGRQLGDALFGDARALADLLQAVRDGQRPPPAVRRSPSLGRWLRIGMAPLATPGAEAAAVVVVEDITEQKALESQLMQNEKLAAVGTLVSGVAHELNNPLTSIAGLSEFLLEQGKTDDVTQGHLRVINDQAERASRIVRNLLSFAHKSPAERAPVDVGDVVQRTVMLMGYALRKDGIAVETSVAPDLPPVLANRDQIQQVLLNLMTNAMYALQTVPEGRERILRLIVDASCENVRMRVADTGPGISVEAAAQIFDPFFTTKPPGEGTGLGLFLSYGIAEAHGGSLTMDSTPGQGATFTLVLPRAPAPGAGAPAPTARTPLRRVLIVDDDEGMRRLAAVFFSAEGHAVTEARTGTEGLAFAESVEYDLVLMDRRAIVGAETLSSALARVRPTWAGRIVVGGAAPGEVPGLRTVPKPYAPRALRAAAAEVWREPG